MNNNDLAYKIKELEKEIEAIKQTRGLQGYLGKMFSKTSVIIGSTVSALLVDHPLCEPDHIYRCDTNLRRRCE